MIKLLEKKLKQKAEMFNFVKHLPISDYEIYAEIDVYIKNKIIPISFDFDFKNQNLSLKRLFEIHVQTREIEEINYTFKVVLQNFYHIKPLNIKDFLDNNEIIKRFDKYKQIFNSIEENIIWLQSKIRGEKRFYFNEYEANNCYGYVVDFATKEEKPLEFSKHLKGTFLMKELEKVYGRYFFRNSYEIWSEIVFGGKYEKI